MKIDKKVKNESITKVPLIMQLEDLECGAACLCMILAYYGKWISLEQVRADCDVSRDGVNAYNIVEAANNYGLKADGYFYDAAKLKEKVKFPCIIYWDRCHFIVLRGIKNNKFYVNDPARGELTIQFEDFKRHYSGAVLTMEPKENFVQEGKKENAFLITLSKIVKFKSLILLMCLFFVIISVFSILTPALDRVYLDRILTRVNILWAKKFFLFVFIFGIVQAIYSILYNKYSLLIAGKIDVISNTTFFWKVLHLPMNFFMQRRAGDIQNRQATNSMVSYSMVVDFAPAILDFIKMIGYLIIMIAYSLPLTIIGLSTVIVNLIISRIVTKKSVNLQSVLIKDESLLFSTTLTGIDSIETIKAAGAEKGFINSWINVEAEANNQRTDISKLNYYYGIIPSMLNSISDIIVIIVGGYLIIKGEFTVGMVLALSTYLRNFAEPTNNIIKIKEKIQEIATKVARIDDVMNYKDDENVVGRSFDVKDARKINGDIELKNVTFGYAKLSDPIIKDFSLKIRKGSMVALVGKSGCGKSTISKLISGLYVPKSGIITYDGKTIKEIDRNIFCSSVAIIDQDITIFRDTISNNIRFFDKSIEDFEIILAANDAQVHDDILSRDGGYDYVISDNAREFSGGQKQKIEIARVLAQDPTILILDEFTSALDNKTEAKVIKAIRDRGITCIIISHRLSIVTMCDEIVVLDKGKIVANGTNDELYRTNELYREFIDNE